MSNNALNRAILGYINNRSNFAPLKQAINSYINTNRSGEVLHTVTNVASQTEQSNRNTPEAPIAKEVTNSAIQVAMSNTPEEFTKNIQKTLNNVSQVNQNKNKRIRSVLEIPNNAPLTENTIKSAYRKLVLIHHPNKGGNSNKFKQITNAKNEALQMLGKNNTPLALPSTSNNKPLALPAPSPSNNTKKNNNTGNMGLTNLFKQSNNTGNTGQSNNTKRNNTTTGNTGNTGQSNNTKRNNTTTGNTGNTGQSNNTKRNNNTTGTTGNTSQSNNTKRNNNTGNMGLTNLFNQSNNTKRNNNTTGQSNNTKKNNTGNTGQSNNTKRNITTNFAREVSKGGIRNKMIGFLQREVNRAQAKYNQSKSQNNLERLENLKRRLSKTIGLNLSKYNTLSNVRSKRILESINLPKNKIQMALNQPLTRKTIAKTIRNSNNATAQRMIKVLLQQNLIRRGIKI